MYSQRALSPTTVSSPELNYKGHQGTQHFDHVGSASLEPTYSLQQEKEKSVFVWKVNGGGFHTGFFIIFKYKMMTANLNDITIAQGNGFDQTTIDLGTIGAAEIFQPGIKLIIQVFIWLQGDFCMMTAGRCIIELDIIIGFASNRYRILVQCKGIQYNTFMLEK